MKDTIIKLEAEIEELKKRLSAIFISHTTVDQLKSITNYFDSVQTYLQNLTTSFNSHTKNFEEYSTKIENLESQIIDINTILNKLPNFDNFDADQINSKVENLTSKIETFETKFNSFIGENDTTLETILNDISSLQTDLGAMQEGIDSINAEISSINSDIGSMQTTITNLSSTQNSLSSAQNSMSANISTLENRVATNETNITTLQESANAVGEFDDRISALETNYDIPFNVCNDRNLVMHLNCLNNPVKSRYYYYRVVETGQVEQNFTLNYTSTGSGTLTINLYENDVLEKTLTVNLSQNASSYSFSHLFMPIDSYQNFQFEVSSTTQVIFSNVYCYFRGINIQIYEYDQDLKFKCCDNKVYVTKYEGTKIKYGMFTKEEFDFNNMILTYEIDDDNETLKNRYAVFSARINIDDDGDMCDFTPILMLEKTDGLTYLYEVNTTSNELTLINSYNLVISGSVETSMLARPMTTGVYNGTPKTYFLSTDYKNVSNAYLTGYTKLLSSWYYFVFAQRNYLKANAKTLSTASARSVSLNKNNYFYFAFESDNVKTLIKLEKGISAYAFMRGDLLGDVFIFDGKNVKKYEVKRTYNSSTGYINTQTFIEEFKNCDFVWEIFDNIFIKHTKNGWELIK